MHEILRNLPAGSLVLDLGCSAGSFPQKATCATIVRVDRELPQNRENHIWFVQGDAARLPFADRRLAGVISNHSLEHFDDPASPLPEIAPLLIPRGSLFI